MASSFYSRFIPFSLFIFSLIFYSATLAPTISWGDSADLAMRMVYDGDTTFVGSHRDYKLYRYVGKLFQLLPFGDAGTRANFMSAFFGGLTVGAVTWIVSMITKSAYAALAAGLSLTVAHSFWLLSVIAEVYTFNAALVYLCMAVVVRWWTGGSSKLLWPASVLAGLSLMHHATGLVLLAAIAPLLLTRWRTVNLIDGVLAFALFSVISLDYWTGALHKLYAGMGMLDAFRLNMSQNMFFEVSPVQEIMKFGAYLTFNFIGASIILGVVGLALAIRHRNFVILPALIWSGAFVYAGVNSSIPDKFNLYVVVYPAFALMVGLGVAWLQTRSPFSPLLKFTLAAFILTVPPVAYLAAVKVSEIMDVDLVGAREAPLRDNAWYFLWPPKAGDYDPRTFAENALDDVAQDGVMIADYTLWRPLYFVQAVEGRRPDVDLIFVERLLSRGVVNWITEQICRKPIFLATDTPADYYQLNSIRERFIVEQSGSIYRIVGNCHE